MARGEPENPDSEKEEEMMMKGDPFKRVNIEELEKKVQKLNLRYLVRKIRS